jgi:hypothetical protein
MLNPARSRPSLSTKSRQPHTRAKTITVPVADKSKVFRNVRIVKAIYGTAWDGNVKITATPASQFVITPQK